MRNSYSNLSLRQLHAELTRQHELFLKSLIDQEPTEFTSQMRDKVTNLLKAIDSRLRAFKKFSQRSSIDLQNKEAFLKVLV